MKTADYESEFLKKFRTLTERHPPWEVWQDFITLTSASIANAVDRRPDIWKNRERDYMITVRKYQNDEQIAFIDLFIFTVLALENNPAQDFLGQIFMKLNLSNHWRGQFFTPWSLAETMARLTATKEELEKRIEEEKYISVCDPASGAGCMLLAFAYVCWNCYHINYQDSLIFVAQDVDPIAAKMCYIQMSLMGCPGYVIVGNTITEPLTNGTILSPVYNRPENIWFTPLYYSNVWSARRAIEQALMLERAMTDADSKSIILRREYPTDISITDTPVEKLALPSKPGGFSFRKFFRLDK